MRDVRKILGENIAKRRKALNLTQEELADSFNVDKSVVSGAEQGRTWPDLKSLEGMAARLQCSVIDFFETAATPAPIAQGHDLTECVRRVSEAALGRRPAVAPPSSGEGVPPAREPTDQEMAWFLEYAASRPEADAIAQAIRESAESRRQAKKKA